MFRILTRFLKHNWFLKLFSLVVASLLWLTIASESNYVIDQTRPINFQGIPANMETTGESATAVTLRLRGSRNELNSMSPADVTAVVSLAGEEPGPKDITLTAANVQTLPGVEVIRIDPPRVTFNLERTLTRSVPVVATIEGRPAEGYRLGSTSVTPATVEVSGPESSVGGLESLSTVPVHIDEAQTSIRESVNLNLDDPTLRLASITPHTVVVEIEELALELDLSIPIDPLLEDSGWIVDTSEIEVRITGPMSLMNAFDTAGLRFTVNTSDLEPGGPYVLETEVLGLAARLDVISRNPARVEVRSANE